MKTPIISVSSTRNAIIYSLTRFSIEFPTREDADRHQEGGQHDEQDRDAVNADLVGDAGVEPLIFAHELKIGRRGIEIDQQHQRDNERDRGREQRDIARIAVGLSMS